MGMAASQARLLCITARQHDVEYQAQAIQSAKVQLATKSDQAYEDYLAALDSTTLTINALNTKTGEKALIPANFNNLCSRNKVTSADGSNYAILNNQGKLLVEESIEEGYHNFRSAGMDDPYQFAMYMLNDGNVQHIGNLVNKEFESEIWNAELEVFNNSEKSTRMQNYEAKLLELCGSENIYDSNNLMNSGDKEKINEYEETLAKFRKELYKSQSAEIYANLENDVEAVEDFDSAMFNYFVNIYNQIKAARGCVSIEDYNGLHGDAANDTEWLQSMIQSGQFSIEIIETDKSTGEVDLDPTSPSSDISLSYTQTTVIDNRALAKAEAEYEHKLKEIDKKDQKFDLDLSKLETERTALTTEYESVKKVVEANIERTFGIFS